MNKTSSFNRLLCYLLPGFVVVLVFTAQLSLAAPRPRPKFEHIEKYVQRHFEGDPSHEQGDIISTSEVNLLLEGLRRMGWRVPGSKRLLLEVPGDNDFVVRKLRTDKGRKFMRKIADFPMTYDRMYRLATLRGGQKIVVDLIQGKGGSEMIQYLTTTRGGKNLSKMLGRTSKGAKFDQPVGKIFTVKALKERLSEIYQQQSKNAATPGV